MTDQRAAIVREARRCVGTPYHHKAPLPGIGLDCATLLKVVFEAAGVRASVALGDYSPQWHLHQDEPRYIKMLVENGCREIGAPSGIGDIAVYKAVALSRSQREYQFAHGAIIVALGSVGGPEPDKPGAGSLRIIHAYQPSGFVLEGDETEFGHLIGAEKKFFTAW